MGYPEELLAPEERLLLHRHPHWKMLFWPAVTLIVATALAGFAGGYASRNTEGTTRSAVLIAVVAIWAVLVVWRCAGPVLRWKSTHFIITDRRVLVREGVLTHTGIDIPMNRIANIQFRHGLSDRLLGTGTLIIDAASGDPLEYDDIPQVQKVHALLYHEVFDNPQNPPYDPRYDRGQQGRH
ncbi:putative membrane protein YdbT with pleckstrin-like domain [Nocardia transvalensis]|uniref:Putative membrane protein YdbT with pleckstrin-like domain n=1 Tax=Nocardia transvalensis TaxID=37333 RepID=A0A7W9PF39_9NOCA|nr:PH domain-containing protein [Nocardia transvalensis]MBB5914841.1 putative membrane protein YdbT with pleckstrin-like domain [Nocardia transvalensis]